MSRSGYTEDWDCDEDSQWAFIRQQGALKSAIRGKRGQAFIKELVAALDAMPEKRLARNLFSKDGEVCALECVARQRGVTLADIDPESGWDVGEEVAHVLNMPETLIRQILWENDEGGEIPEQRWRYMRQWAKGQIR